jgi:hypothetical protein
MTALTSNLPAPRRSWYVVSIWAERQPDCPPAWRGSIETTDGKRIYFATLAELNQALARFGGWADPQAALRKRNP